MKKLLLVIDMQNDFIDGALGTAEAVSILSNVRKKIASYPSEDVWFTRDTHEENYMETQEGKNLPVPHCIRGTEGWEIRPELLEGIESPVIVDKPTFGSTRLAEMVAEAYDAEHGDLEVEVIGLCTDICVVSNALLLKAVRPEMVISVDPACCAGVTPAAHEAALQTMASCQIQMVNGF